MQTTLPTMFAPAERASDSEIKSAHRALSDTPFLTAILDSLATGIVMLNRERQIVLANKGLLKLVQESDPSKILGKRLGEAIQCIHAFETAGGCGTTEFCKTCGAAKAVVSSIDGKADVQECRITLKPAGESLDLRVWATPFIIHNAPLTIFAIMDISDEKRRKVLERIFFHDILNTASGLKGFAELLKEADSGEAGQYQATIFSLSRMIVDEINSQRMLVMAENNELTLTPSEVSSLELLRNIADLYRTHEVAKDRSVTVDPQAQDTKLTTDRTLLLRVIGNMTKNALEACKPGETVTIGCTVHKEQVQFWVHNPNEMPRDVQLQVFQRSFSTKGSGRGLGTYSIKLLTERYLKGSASFVSGKDGTTFKVAYPVSI